LRLQGRIAGVNSRLPSCALALKLIAQRLRFVEAVDTVGAKLDYPLAAPSLIT